MSLLCHGKKVNRKVVIKAFDDGFMPKIYLFLPFAMCLLVSCLMYIGVLCVLPQFE